MKKLSDINLLDIGHTVQMAGAVYIGNGRTFLFPFPEDSGDIDLAHADVFDMNIDDWTTFLRQTDLMEIEVNTKDAAGKIVKAITRKSQRQIDQGVSWQVWKRDGYRCRYCGNNNIPLTVDHLVPWESMGPSIPANLVSACRKCNKTRGNLSYKEWMEHPFYMNVSANLSPSEQIENLRLIETLDAIPRMVHVRSR